MQSNIIEFRTSRGNLRLVADAYGDPQQQPVLLAHGGGQTRFAWGKTAQQIAAEGFYAVALDLRGHGESDWAEDNRRARNQMQNLQDESYINSMNLNHSSSFNVTD